MAETPSQASLVYQLPDGFDTQVVGGANIVLQEDASTVDDYKAALGSAACFVLQQHGVFDLDPSMEEAARVAIRRFVELVAVDRLRLTRFMTALHAPRHEEEEDVEAVGRRAEQRNKQIAGLLQVGLLRELLNVRIQNVLLTARLSEAEDARNRDSLTGLTNLRGAHQLFARQGAAPVTALFVDLDKFGLINKTFDQTIGDQLLRIVARGLVGKTRPGVDHVVRCGGEEFCIVMPGHRLQTMQKVAFRISSQVTSWSIQTEGRVASVSATCVLGTGRADELFMEDQTKDPATFSTGPLIGRLSAISGEVKGKNQRGLVWKKINGSFVLVEGPV